MFDKGGDSILIGSMAFSNGGHLNTRNAVQVKLCLLTWLPKTEAEKNVHPLPSVKYLWQSVKTCCRCCQLQSGEPTKWISPRSPLFHWNPFQHDDDTFYCRYVSAVQGCRLEIVKRRWGSAGQIGSSAPPPPLLQPLKPLKKTLKYFSKYSKPQTRQYNTRPFPSPWIFSHDPSTL